MFSSLSERLEGILSKLAGKGVLSEADVDLVLRDIRRALIEADVSLEVVKQFVELARGRAVGSDVLRAVNPGHQVVKIVNDTLISVLGGTDQPKYDFTGTPPVVIMMVGLQGSGKTTSSAKLARRFKNARKKVLMASLDVRRPAAQEQLAVLGQQLDVDTLPIVTGQSPVEICERAVGTGRRSGYDLVILDTAGRTHVDEELMMEMEQVRNTAQPDHVILVADSLTGQDAVQVARSFDERVNLSGIILTRVDGDGRGGAALSMRAVTGKPILFLGVSEKLDGLEEFDPSRMADRILGQGDIVALVEKAKATVDEEKAVKMAKRLEKGIFTLDDLAEQLKQMINMGGMGGIMGMMPGMGNLKKQMGAALPDSQSIKKQIAVVQSMTKKERRDPKLLNFSRKKRIAAGSGADLQDINKILKMHRQMADVMKMMKNKPGKLAGLAGMLGLGKGMPMPGAETLASQGGAEFPAGISAEEIEALAKQAPTQGATGFRGLTGGMPGLPGLGSPQMRTKKFKR